MKTTGNKRSAKRLLSLLLCLILACSLLPTGVLAARTSVCPNSGSAHNWNTVNNISYSLTATKTDIGVKVYECSNCHQLRTAEVTLPTGTTYRIPYDTYKDYIDVTDIPDLDNLTEQGQRLHRNSIGCLLYGRVDVVQQTGYYHNNIGRTQVTVHANGSYDGIVLCGEPWYSDVLQCGTGFCDIRVERDQGEYYDPFNVYLVNFGITIPDYRSYELVEENVNGHQSAHYEYDIDHPSTKGIKSITVEGNDINVYLINCNVGYQERWNNEPRGGDMFQDEIPYSFTASVSGLNSHIYMGSETNSEHPGLVRCDAVVADPIPEQYLYYDTYGGKFAPDDYITREQLVTILCRFSKYKGETVASSDNLGIFSDAGLISPYAAESMSWAVERGMIRGNDDGTADPRGNATRAQVAQIMMNYLTK